MMPKGYSRRKFLALCGLVLAGGDILGKAFADSGVFTSNPFKLGVASGSPRHDGFVLWTRLLMPDSVRAPVKVNWEVAEDDGFRRIVQKGGAMAVPELSHSVHVEVGGLKPDRWYWYRFTAGDAQSETGRTRTFPGPETAVNRLRFAFGSCQRWEDGYYAAYRHMLSEDPDCVVFLGDYIYEYPSRINAVRSHTLPHAVTLNDYRRRYELHKSDPDLQRMHSACPWLVTWDDHEVQNNYAGRYSVIDDGDFLARRTAAYQAFYEHMPLRASALLHGIAGLGRPDALRVYDRFHFGRLATFHLLDGRQYRDLPLCPEPPKKPLLHCMPKDSFQRTMLGPEQERWIEEGFGKGAENGTNWNIIAQQTAFTRRDIEPGKDVRLSTDTWDGYAGARKRLIDSLVKSKAGNPIFIGGDIHQNWVAHVHQDPESMGSPVIAGEFCVTSISSISDTPQELAEKLSRENPHSLFASSERRGYGVVEITPKQCEVSLRVLDDAGRKDSGIETLAGFVVEDSSPRIRRVK